MAAAAQCNTSPRPRRAVQICVSDKRDTLFVLAGWIRERWGQLPPLPQPPDPWDRKAAGAELSPEEVPY